jgi:hypothetical protein
MRECFKIPNYPLPLNIFEIHKYIRAMPAKERGL